MADLSLNQGIRFSTNDDHGCAPKAKGQTVIQSDVCSGGSQHGHVEGLIQRHHFDRSTIDGQLVKIQTA